MSYVPGIIATWEAQAGTNRDGVGFALSVAFINWPSLFLKHMDGHPEAFRSWLESLQRHTFDRPEEPGRGAWVVDQMHKVAVEWDGVRYRDMIDSIRQATERVARQPEEDQ